MKTYFNGTEDELMCPVCENEYLTFKKVEAEYEHVSMTYSCVCGKEHILELTPYKGRVLIGWKEQP